MRSILAGGKEPPENLMRPEIIKALEGVPIFIDQEDQWVSEKLFAQSAQ